jgi:hypothetical protein
MSHGIKDVGKFAKARPQGEARSTVGELAAGLGGVAAD